MTAAPQSKPAAGTEGTTASSIVPALRNALAAALVAFGLCFPIISYHAESNINNELVLISRWPLSLGHLRDRLPVLFLPPGVAPGHPRMVRPDRRGRRRRHGRRARRVGRRRGGDRGAFAGPLALLAVVRTVRARRRDPLSPDHAGAARTQRLTEVDQQLRRSDPDLRDAGLGAEHRGRARGPARPRLRRLLRRRRLFLRAAVDHLRPVVLDLSPAGRPARRDVGSHPRLSPSCACVATISRS